MAVCLFSRDRHGAFGFEDFIGSCNVRNTENDVYPARDVARPIGTNLAPSRLLHERNTESWNAELHELNTTVLAALSKPESQHAPVPLLSAMQIADAGGHVIGFELQRIDWSCR